MSVSKLATAITVLFIASVVALAGELLYVLCRRRSFRRRASPPLPSGEQTFPDAVTKELLYFLCLKPHVAVEPTGEPNRNPDGSSPEDQVVDVFKLLEANGPSRFLCTIKEEEKEDVESTPDVDFSGTPATVNEGEPAEEVAVTKTEFSTPCDSPFFFTPAGSPARDGTESEYVVTVHVTGNGDDN